MKFILGCRFTFKAYAKNIKDKMTKYSLETGVVLFDADGHVLSLIFIKDQGTVAPNKCTKLRGSRGSRRSFSWVKLMDHCRGSNS